MIRWRDPTEAETTYFLAKLKKDLLIDAAFWIMWLIVALPFPLAIIVVCINSFIEGKLKPDVTLVPVLGFFAVFAFIIYACIRSLIKVYDTPGLYRRGEIEIVSGVLQQKWMKQHMKRSTEYFVRVEMEDGSTIDQEVKRGLYNNVSDRTPVNVVRVKSEDFMWKDEYGIFMIE